MAPKQLCRGVRSCLRSFGQADCVVLGPRSGYSQNQVLLNEVLLLSTIDMKCNYTKLMQCKLGV